MFIKGGGGKKRRMGWQTLFIKVATGTPMQRCFYVTGGANIFLAQELSLGKIKWCGSVQRSTGLDTDWESFVNLSILSLRQLLMNNSGLL